MNDERITITIYLNGEAIRVRPHVDGTWQRSKQIEMIARDNGLVGADPQEVSYKTDEGDWQILGESRHVRIADKMEFLLHSIFDCA